MRKNTTSTVIVFCPPVKLKINVIRCQANEIYKCQVLATKQRNFVGIYLLILLQICHLEMLTLKEEMEIDVIFLIINTTWNCLGNLT